LIKDLDDIVGLSNGGVNKWDKVERGRHLFAKQLQILDFD